MFHAAQMISMAKDAQEIKDDLKNATPIAAVDPKPPSAPVYPCGLCLSFDEDVLEKLGLDGTLPPVGTKFHFCAEARVTSVSQNEREEPDGTKETFQRVEVQITDMGIPGASDGERSMQASEARKSALYKRAEPDGDEA